ncbi:MAG: hypothetical protein IJT33_00335 [Campylobacter sp.]|nr:hypothetical protein [Campylobacter sp.]MBQ7674896.1 hypothetical protein [Campylobacter sp.]MBQ9292174.1 hypothetical protein [Campylobacter sp.]MBR0071715.1 hypothetical protein [Campylobacter sp.]
MKKIFSLLLIGIAITFLQAVRVLEFQILQTHHKQVVKNLLAPKHIATTAN